MIDYRLWHPICLAIILGMLGISAYCLILLAPYDDAWSAEAVTFMTGDAMAMVLCLILFASIYMDKKIGLDMLFFMCLLSLEFILLLTEFQRMYVETYDPSSYIVWLSYLIGNSLFPVLVKISQGIQHADPEYLLHLQDQLRYKVSFRLLFLLSKNKYNNN